MHAVVARNTTYLQWLWRALDLVAGIIKHFYGCFAGLRGRTSLDGGNISHAIAMSGMMKPSSSRFSPNEGLPPCRANLYGLISGHVGDVPGVINLAAKLRSGASVRVEVSKLVEDDWHAKLTIMPVAIGSIGGLTQKLSIRRLEYDQLQNILHHYDLIYTSLL